MTVADIPTSRMARFLKMRMMRRLLDRVRGTEDFATFWHGPLDPITYTCLASFPFHGVPLRLYCYQPPEKVPDGVTLIDAHEIIADEGMLQRYVVRGKPSLSKFSNYFRYRLIQKTGACWVDSDMLCLRKPDFIGKPILFGTQAEEDDASRCNGAVLKLPRRHRMLRELEERARSGIDIDTRWGVLGPMLITELASKHGIDAVAEPRDAFYPLRPREFWKVLLPEHRDEVVHLATRSTFLHLWHELYRRSKYNKERAPPKGSFLYQACATIGTLDMFLRPYRPEAIRTRYAERIEKARSAHHNVTGGYDSDEPA